ncbi:MAG: glycosyltransferase family 4 protein [bacterium]
MKIALVRKKYISHGGAERYLQNLIEELLETGHEVHLFANKWEITGEKVLFHRIRIVGGFSFLKVLSFAVFSYLELKKYSFDVIYSLEKTFYQDIYRAGDGCHKEWLLQRRKINPPIKNLLDLINPLHLIICHIEKKIFKKGNYRYIIANSYQGKEEIIRHYKVEPERIKVIYNGIENNSSNVDKKVIRNKLGLRNDEFTILFVGSGFERKGLFYLIQAVRELKNLKGEYPVKLFVLGKGKEGRYQKFIRSYNLYKDIIFLGPTKDVKEFYQAGDVLVLPSIYEPFSNVCLEAMSFGLPVITSKINGASEIINDGKNGYIVDDPGDFKTIALKLEILLDKEVRERVGEQARMTVKNLTPRENALRTIEVLSLGN